MFAPDVSFFIFLPFPFQIKNQSAKCKIEEVTAAKRQFHILDIRVKDGIRTRDPWNHNPMLYPTELLSPLRFPPYRIQLKNESAKCKIEEAIAAKRQFHIFDT
jgi:hypothetical protein